jgi:hypothetical protein
MADRSDLWAPPVRKWMMDWHSPVAGMFDKPRTFRGSAGADGQPVRLHGPSLLLESSGYLLLEGLGSNTLLLEQ